MSSTPSFKGTYFKRDVALLEPSANINNYSHVIRNEVRDNEKLFEITLGDVITAVNVKNFSIKGKNFDRETGEFVIASDTADVPEGTITIIADIATDTQYDNASLSAKIPVPVGGTEVKVNLIKCLNCFAFPLYEIILQGLDISATDKNGASITVTGAKLKIDFSKLCGCYVNVDKIGTPDLEPADATFSSDSQTEPLPTLVSTSFQSIPFNKVPTDVAVRNENLFEFSVYSQTDGSSGSKNTITSFTTNTISISYQSVSGNVYTISTKGQSGAPDVNGNLIINATMAGKSSNQGSGIDYSGDIDLKFPIPVNADADFTLEIADGKLPSAIDKTVLLHSSNSLTLELDNPASGQAKTLDVCGGLGHTTTSQSTTNLTLNNLHDLPVSIDTNNKLIIIDFSEFTTANGKDDVPAGTGEGAETAHTNVYFNLKEFQNRLSESLKLDVGFTFTPTSGKVETLDKSSEITSIEVVGKYNTEAPTDGHPVQFDVTKFTLKGSFVTNLVSQQNPVVLQSIDVEAPENQEEQVQPFAIKAKWSINNNVLLYVTEDKSFEGIDTPEETPKVIKPVIKLFNNRELKATQKSVSGDVYTYEIEFTNPVSYVNLEEVEIQVLSENLNFEETFRFVDSARKDIVTFTSGRTVYDSLGFPFEKSILNFDKDAGFRIPIINEIGELSERYIRIFDLVKDIDDMKNNSVVPYLADRLHALEVACAYVFDDNLGAETPSPLASHLLSVKNAYSILDISDLN